MEKQKKPTIYTVATAHLDTVWNWTFETTVEKYIPATLDDNFKLFEKYILNLKIFFGVGLQFRV